MRSGFISINDHKGSFVRFVCRDTKVEMTGYLVGLKIEVGIRDDEPPRTVVACGDEKNGPATLFLYLDEVIAYEVVRP